MKKHVKLFEFIKTLKIKLNFLREYLKVPKLLFDEMKRISSIIQSRKRFSNDSEVILGSLRTSAHIIDKGLQADSWERGHGHNRYHQLCSEIERLKSSEFKTDPSYLWGVDKKNEYEKAQNLGPRNFKITESNQNYFNKIELTKLIQSRRSIRSFEDLEIKREILDEVVNVINWAPSSCNRQPTKLFITNSPMKINICLAQCAGATCLGNKIPCFISVCADIRHYQTTDRNLAYIDASLGLQNMLLMLHANNIGATILNWQHNTQQEDYILRKELNIPKYYLIIVNLVIGYYKKQVPAPARKNKELSYIIIN